MCKTRFSSGAITLNRFGLVFGIHFVTVIPLIADIRARGMYTALEREGIINMDKLLAHPAFRTFDTRNAVPYAIVGLSQVALLISGALLTTLAYGNLRLWRRLKQSAESSKQPANTISGDEQAVTEHRFWTGAMLQRLAWAALIALMFGIGYATHFATSLRWFQQSMPATVAEHWQTVDVFRSHLGHGMPHDWQFADHTQAAAPLLLESSLIALYAAGEIDFVDLVFPRVPHTLGADADWEAFIRHCPEFIWAVGNRSDPRFVPSGQQPLHLRLWFKKAADDDVRELIHRLENLAAPPIE